MKKVLVIGSSGQIGTELVIALRSKFGKDNVIASDVRKPVSYNDELGPFELLDVMDAEKVEALITKNNIDEVYLLAALLSGTAEKNPAFAWQLNMDGLFTLLNLAKDKKIKKIFWPSSIAVFGPTTPKKNTPQNTITEPNTVYGISKLAGERWCEYYHNKYGVDVRSIRYPGLISYGAPAGGGTTDYAVEIFYEAKRNNTYTSFLTEETSLPMMYMEDAINATIGIMEAPKEKIKVRSSYNLGGISFNPKELSQAIQKRLPDFKIAYNPDFRQEIANSWPSSIDDSVAQKDWGWNNKFDLDDMVDIMLNNVKVETTI